MNKPVFKSKRRHEAAFDNAMKVALQAKPTEGHFPMPPASKEDLYEARECYLAHTEIVEATVEATSRILKSPELSDRIKYFGRNMVTEGFQSEGQELIRDIVETGGFDTVFQLAKLVGVKAIGLGVAGSFQLLLAGAEKGYEGMWVLPDDNYGIVNPNQFTTRNWGMVTVGVDLMASAGINLSFWFNKPETSALVGVFADLILPVGLRFSYIKTLPVPDERPSPPFNKPNATFAGFSLRPSIGLEIGGGVFGGIQRVPADSPIIDLPDRNLMTLNLENPATGASSVQIGVPATLNCILMPPAGGDNDPCVLTTNETKLAFAMPDFLSGSVEEMTVNLDGWQQESSSDTTLNLTYVGSNNVAWNDNLEFTIDCVESNPGETPTTGTVRTVVTNGDINWKTSTQLELVNLSFSASLTSWNLKLGSGCTLAPPPEGYPDSTLPSAGSNVPVYCPNDNAGWTQLTQFIDTNGARDVTWNVGIYFFQSGTTPMMQAVIWKDGTSWANGTKYVGSPAKEVTTTNQELPIAYYQNGESTTLTVSVQLND